VTMPNRQTRLSSLRTITPKVVKICLALARTAEAGSVLETHPSCDAARSRLVVDLGAIEIVSELFGH
jgi:hypothetical protein